MQNKKFKNVILFILIIIFLSACSKNIIKENKKNNTVESKETKTLTEEIKKEIGDGVIITSHSYQIGAKKVYYDYYDKNESDSSKIKSSSLIRVFFEDSDDDQSLGPFFIEQSNPFRRTEPHFERTSNPYVALLVVDDGVFSQRIGSYHYIDLKTGDHVTIRNEFHDGYNFFRIKTTDESQREIKPFIRNECYYWENKILKNRYGENSYLNDLTLNGEKLHIIKEEKILKCEYGSESGLVPNVNLKYVGINNNLTKVFFSLISTDEENFVFDINTKKVSKAIASDLLN